MSLRQHPEVQILISEIEKLMLENEGYRELLEKTADQLIRLQLEYARVMKAVGHREDLPFGCPPEFRLERVSDTIKAIESFMDYKDQE